MIDQIIKFLKTNIWGLIILGGLGSILGTVFIYFIRKIYFWLGKHYSIFRTKTYFKKIIERYSEGYMVGVASQSEIHQTALIGRYIIDIVINSTILIGLLIVSFGFLSFLPFATFWIVIFLTGILIVFPIRRIKKSMWLFKSAFDQHYNEEEIKEKANEFLKESLKDLKKGIKK